MADFGVYVHVPFCVRRCGYCDFNTYTSAELLEGGSPSKNRDSFVTSYPSNAIHEIRLAQRWLVETERPSKPATTVFFGGGTPTVLPSSDLMAILDAIRATWGLAPGAEITTEANPDSVTPQSLDELAAGGFTRISFGMQSAVPHVLRTLDRTHDAARIPDVVGWAREAGLAVSLDLIYGTPGESLADWRRSCEAAIATGVDHISAYALTVVSGTKMYAQIQHGELPAPDDDDEAAKYELADELFTAAGLEWYEISNWARGGITGPNVCRHNLGYWRSEDWWGIGPGAHSYLNGNRWWNVKHPRRYAEMLAAGVLPIEDSETLTPEQAMLERIMLETRLADGMPIEALEASATSFCATATGQNLDPRFCDSDYVSMQNDDNGALKSRTVANLIAQQLIDPRAAITDRRIVLTLKGRLLADTVVHTLTK
jgi:putative oxygen-independent coproporphyrinogen III oxidase